MPNLAPDFSAHLTAAEENGSKVYELLCRGKDALAILAILDTIREYENVVEWLIRKHTKGK